MGNCGATESKPGCRQRFRDYYADKKLAYEIYLEAKANPGVTQTVQRPDLMLKNMKKTITYYDKFYRLATTPMGFIDLKDFYDDLDELVLKHRPENMPINKQPDITVEQFLKFFREKKVWETKFYKERNGDLMIKKLLTLSRDRLSDPCKKHALVTANIVNIFNFKVLGFLVCRGTQEEKCNILWDLIWNEKNCQGRRKALKWDMKNLKLFFKKLFGTPCTF